MRSSVHHISDLLYKYCTEEELSPEDQADLDHWLMASPANSEVLAKLRDAATLQADLLKLSDINREVEDAWEVFNREAKVSSGDISVRRVHFFKQPWFRYAAAIILLLGVGTYFWNKNTSSGINVPSATSLAETKTDVAPGSEGAVLTLADGSTVVLDSLGNGLVAAQAGAKIMLENGQLAYTATDGAAAQIAWNTMSTPRGRQFRVVLPDGTRVWLNAASSISYPTMFTGNERKVIMTGEVYFEVAENKNVPFRVSAGGMDIEVLGTHFNVNAYPDEDISRTTLLEGSIKLKTAKQEAVIRPGEQAQLRSNNEGGIHLATGIDLLQVMAWQKGLFKFNNTSLPDIMRVVSRWYDIDVIYEAKPTNKKFGGGISMKLPLSNLLQMLEANGVHFTLEGRTLKVVE